MATVDDVLEFWFGNTKAETPPKEISARWWKKDPEFDAEIGRRFGALHDAIAGGEHDEWLDTPLSCVAYVIVLDQFSRNMFRGTAKSFAFDERALKGTDAALGKGHLASLGADAQVFSLMPLMHSEDRQRQKQSVAEFAALCDRVDPGQRDRVASNLDYAKRHAAIVERFGRYPHRNEILGRESTDEEREFLTQPGSSF